MGRLLDLARGAAADEPTEPTQVPPVSSGSATVATVAAVAVANPQKVAADAAEVRRLVEAIAAAAPARWGREDIEEAIRIAQGDLAAAVLTYRALAADARKGAALAHLDAHPQVKRVCFADTTTDAEHVILTIALREPWGAIEVLVGRERFDAIVLMELSLRHPDTALQVLEGRPLDDALH